MFPRQLILLSWSAHVDSLMSKRCHCGPVCSESSERLIAEVTYDDKNSCATYYLIILVRRPTARLFYADMLCTKLTYYQVSIFLSEYCTT